MGRNSQLVLLNNCSTTVRARIQLQLKQCNNHILNTELINKFGRFRLKITLETVTFKIPSVNCVNTMLIPNQPCTSTQLRSISAQISLQIKSSPFLLYACCVTTIHLFAICSRTSAHDPRKNVNTQGPRETHLNCIDLYKILFKYNFVF